MMLEKFSTHTVLVDMNELVKADKALIHPLYFAFIFCVYGLVGHQLINILGIGSSAAAVRVKLKKINTEEKSRSREQVAV